MRKSSHMRNFSIGNTVMRNFALSTTFALSRTLALGTAAALALSVGMASAQQKTEQGPQHPPPEMQQKDAVDPRSEAVAPMNTVPPPGAPANPQSPEADLLKPGSVGPAQAATPGGGEEPGVPGATRQTMPSTISKENAAQDKMPIMSFGFPLTDEQKRTIAQSVKSMPADSQNSDGDQRYRVANRAAGHGVERISGGHHQVDPGGDAL